MKRLKSIDELYDEVRGYDLVITNDVALETALNSRIDGARVGHFCITPRHLAYLLAPSVIGSPVVKDMVIIARIRAETGLDLRYIYSEVKNIREIRKYRAEVRGFLTTSKSKRVYDAYMDQPSVEKVMAGEDLHLHPFFTGKRIAVIAPELFNALDKGFNDPYWDVIDIFTDEEYSIGEIRAVGNDRQLAENAADLITKDTADDFAIVVDASGPMADAVRAALYRRSLPFINRMEVRDMAAIRDYLSFLTLSFNYDTVRVKQVKELFAAYNGFFSNGVEEYILSRQDESVMKRKAVYLRDVMKRVCHEGMTFDEVKQAVCFKGTVIHVTNLLRDLDLEDVTVTPGELANLRYAVENINDLTNTEQRQEDEVHGVLLADCKNSMYIDRPVVLYLGMGPDWDVKVVGKRYMDAEAETQRNACKLSALLQQGQRRVYMVNTTKDGAETVPALTFDVIRSMDLEGRYGDEADEGRKRPVERFEDICGGVVTGRWATPAAPVGIERGELGLDSDREFDNQFSKSSYNAFRYCHRKYMFASLLRDSEKKYTVFGNLIHDFAELYACHPDAVREYGVDRMVDLISDRYAGLSSPAMGGIDRDRVDLAVRNVMAYLDTSRRSIGDLTRSNKGRDHPNELMQALDVDGCSPSCEYDHHGRRHPIHGIFDLYADGIVTDYKTGKGKSGTKIANDLSPEGNEEPEFQPLIYLALADELEGSLGVFEQFYIMDSDVDSRSPGYDIRSSVRTISISDECLMATAMGDPGFEDALAAARINKDVKERLPAFLAALSENASGDPSGWEADQDLHDRIVRGMGMKVGKTNREKVRPAVKEVAKLLKDGYVRKEDGVVVPRETLDRFLEELDRHHLEAVAMSRTSFDANPVGDCSKCEYRAACTMAIVTAQEDAEDE